MSEDSLAEFCNPHLDKEIYSFTLSERQPEIISHYDANLLRANCLSPPSLYNFYGPGLAQRRPTRSSREVCVYAILGHLNGISNTF
jgi:hypothetical protein